MNNEIEQNKKRIEEAKRTYENEVKKVFENYKAKLLSIFNYHLNMVEKELDTLLQTGVLELEFIRTEKFVDPCCSLYDLIKTDKVKEIQKNLMQYKNCSFDELKGKKVLKAYTEFSTQNYLFLMEILDEIILSTI